MTSRVFISMTGPEGNLGDILIRRAVLDSVRGDNHVVAFVARHSIGWVDAMGFTSENTVVHGGRGRRLLWLLSSAFSSGRPVLVTDPGEVWVGRKRLAHHLLHLAIGVVIKARGGAIIIPPHAIAQQAAAPISNATLSLHRKFARLADVCLWREPWSFHVAATGHLVPDIAMSQEIRAGVPDDERRLCLVSLRGDRARLTPTVLSAITEAARRAGLEVVTLAQVDVDKQRAKEIADVTGSRIVIWDSGEAEAEERLREVYDRAALVISDRLHVLILGMLSGVVPVELAPSPEPKIASHFDVIGFRDMSLDTASRSSDDITSWLEHQLSRRQEAKTVAIAAHAELDGIFALSTHTVR